MWNWHWATEEWRWRLHDNARKIRKIGKFWCTCNGFCFTHPFLLGPVFFRTTLPCSSGDHLERDEMPLHDAVGINCKKVATTENQGAGVKYMVKGVYIGWLYVCYLTWHDYPSLVEWESHGILLYYLLLIKLKNV